MRYLRALTLILCGISVSPFVHAQCSVDADASEALKRLQQARNTHSVSGTFLRESAGAREFLSISRDEEGVTNTALYFNSEAGNATQTFHVPLGPDLTACDVVRHYTLRISPGPKVAGKRTQMLQFRPKDTLRLGYRLALEEESGVILRSDTISEQGELLERHEFATVNITRLSNQPMKASQSDENPRFVKISGLPSGYRASLARGFEEQALFVSDGIAAATVVFEKLPSNVQPGEGAVRRGATLTYTRGSFVSGSKLLVTVTGEIPLAAARVIADAVKLTAGRQ